MSETAKNAAPFRFLRRIAERLTLRKRELERFFSYGREFAVVERRYFFRPRLNSLSIEAPGMSLCRIPLAGGRDTFLDFGLDFAPGERVLLLGGGGFALVRRALARGWGKTADSVELCPEVARIARKYFFEGLEGRVEVHTGDAAEFVIALAEKGGTELYDLAFLDVFRGDELAHEVFRPEFARALAKILKKSGAAVCNLGWKDPDNIRSCARTLAEVFDCARILKKKKHYFLVASSSAWPGGPELEKSNPFFVRDLKKRV